jgi:hypothetical protein
VPRPLEASAFHGIAGQLVKAIEPHTEADPFSLLIQFLVTFGNIIGRGPHFMTEADRQGMNLFVVLVGQTSKARKGTSWGHVERLYRTIAERVPQASLTTRTGLVSGEGLVWAFRDPIPSSEYRKKPDPGVVDKRLFVYEAEFAGVLKAIERDGNTLSPIIRDGWDGRDLETMAKGNPARVTAPHLSIVAHITLGEVRRELTRTECANGFANRFLFGCVNRSKLLPEGGSVPTELLAPIITELVDVVATFCDMDDLHLTRDAEARALWCRIYGDLSRDASGLVGAVTARAEAQVTRLSCLYALLDGSTVVSSEHLRAALAVWKYCEQSAMCIFGDAVGDPIADTILRGLRADPAGLTRTAISDIFKRNVDRSRIDAAVGLLDEAGMAFRQTDRGGGGRPVERWFAHEYSVN